MSTTDKCNGNGNGAHILVFPFPAPGHIIPILDLTHQFLTRGLTVTVLVTPTHLPLLDPLLKCFASTSIQPLVLTPPEVPTSTMFRDIVYMRALSTLSDPIAQWFRSHASPPVAIVSDFLLGWTQHLASDLGVPRIVFWSSGAFAASTIQCLWRDLPKVDESDDGNSTFSLVKVPNCPKYPCWQITNHYGGYKAGHPDWEFFRSSLLANHQSWGAVFNSFTELERVYLDHVKKEMGHDRVWTVGPLLPVDDDDRMVSTNRGGSNSVPTQEVISWLDSKGNGSVVYVCFGSRWTLTNQQVEVLQDALERSGVNFILVVKGSDKGHLASDISLISKDFEDRVVNRGFVIKGWAPQVVILRHQAVGAFVTHCGWNSVLEGLAAGVMMLTWPLGADQFINANLLVDQLGVAIRFFEDGTRSIPNSAELARLLAESVIGCKSRRDRVMELRDATSKAIKGGSSSIDMDELVKQLYGLLLEPANVL
ncbi:flavonol 3-O-glucosyltransferase UGT89B1-like [Actinidia eriantha]|uniref:flavonol 3-O-glucosyltransferase UGT89B1-like n=1 Tax=Actinidia eriantha TaxID=165200 RepID=UPI002589161F|nr:flavonol 3-O-glucosyltransferase UGT89B1-like [Actinidia eriantha]